MDITISKMVKDEEVWDVLEQVTAMLEKNNLKIVLTSADGPDIEGVWRDAVIVVQVSESDIVSFFGTLSLLTQDNFSIVHVQEVKVDYDE